MADIPRKFEFTLAGRNKQFTVITGGLTEFHLKRIPVYVLEMEDVCFHDGSALLLPEDPVGLKEGESSSQEQKKVSGVAALSLVYRKFEEDPNKRLLIAGHDDTNGKAREGFAISKLRAEGILYLLTGNKDLWVDHASKNHSIKDYQQILKFYRFKRGWDCDPGQINGEWNTKTEKATSVLFDVINRAGISSEKLDIAKVISSPAKKWPPEVWKQIYTVYENMIFSLLIGAQWTPDDAVAARKKLIFVDQKTPYVACGESFPIDGLGKDNFRSQKNRRVEFLFFDKDELPPDPLNCPKQIDAVHTKKECPLYNIAYYTRTYIKPDDINTVLYHLKFEYFDKIHNDWCCVPEGVEVKAFKAGKLCTCRSGGSHGIFNVRVQNIPGGKRDDDIHFIFETKGAWIYTKDKQTLPCIVHTFADADPKLPKTPITRDELAKKPLNERLHFYDLPEQWDSRNWFCKIDQKEGEFKSLIKDITSTTAPMVFCLDDIVLVDEKGKQAIKDKNEQNVAKSLDGDSRVSLFFVNDGKLKLFSPENPDAPYFSKIPFTRNRISTPPGKSHVIAFANDFFTIGNIRTSGTCDISKGEILGCRAACKDDPSKHFGEMLDDAHNSFKHQMYFAKGTGNFELHYFHEVELIEVSGKFIPRSFVIVYWSARFASNTTNVVTPAQISLYKTKGLLNAKLRWEHKNYTFEPNNPLTAPHEIIPVFFFECKKTHSGGKEKCLVTISSDSSTGWMGNVTSDMYYEDYKDRDYLGKGTYIDIDGKRYGTLVVAHELGHATGKDDEYAYTEGDNGSSARNAQDGPYTQYYSGMPYNIDDGSMMVSNRAPRMRQYWFFVNWINECSSQADKLGGLLRSEQFKIVHRYNKKQLNYYLPKSPKDFRDIYTTGDPAYFERKVSTVTGSVDIALYKIGEDETAHSIKVAGRTSVKPWDSICVVSIKIGVKFGYDKAHGGGDAYVYDLNGWPKKWGDATGINTTIYSDWRKSFGIILNNIQKRFWMEDFGAANIFFRNTYIHFFPIVLPDPFTDSDGNVLNLSSFTNYDITVNLNDSAKIGGRANKVLKAGNNTSVSWLVRYILGTDDGTAAPTANIPVDITHLKFLQDWLRKKLGSATLTIKGA